MLLGRDMGEKSGLDVGPRWEGCVDGEGKRERLGVDITDVDTTLMGEKDAITLTFGGDANIELSVGRVGKEGLDDEVVQSARNSLNLL